MWIVWKPDHTEQNPHLVNTTISPDRVKLVLFIEPPDWLDLFADFGGAEFLNRLAGVLVPEGKPGLDHRGSVCWKAMAYPVAITTASASTLLPSSKRAPVSSNPWSFGPLLTLIWPLTIILLAPRSAYAHFSSPTIFEEGRALLTEVKTSAARPQ